LPNGYLVIEGHRTILVNSENQVSYDLRTYPISTPSLRAASHRWS
jgi:hypothetical protein